MPAEKGAPVKTDGLVKEPMTGRTLLCAHFENLVPQKSSVYELLLHFPIPDHFWKATASTTGKYHPSFSVGEGGLMRHTMLNMYWVTRWANFFDASPSDLATAVCAAALHDTYKGGYTPDWTTTVPDHPFIAAHEIRKYADLEAGTDGMRDRWYEVADAVYTHMGRFTAEPRNPKNGVFDPIHLENMSVAGKMLALSDYAAAQKVYDELPGIIAMSTEPFDPIEELSGLGIRTADDLEH